MGRRGDVVLLQGEVAKGLEELVRRESLPFASGKARARRGDRTHHHPGQQLVQEPTTA